MVERVIATPAALELIQQLQAEHGSIMFHQSGGCCDNSAANLSATDLTIGPYDIKLGEVGGVPFYIGKLQYDYWKHTADSGCDRQPRRTFSRRKRKAFHTRSRLFTDEEWAQI
jgi:uncharacterized protein (DUF779 family)